MERCHLLDQRATERHEQARKEVDEIRASAVEEAEEALANARESARGVLYCNATPHEEYKVLVTKF
jgi:F0F1-type ATP synthase membrane subunit b/b'